ncbi:hypothetical protein FS749_012732 [Ceratobasidium sp. UAMH 11750]|nr:hypothetical protein FS749_012732 [Ceratobasidium sp. UAMH 11750]
MPSSPILAYPSVTKSLHDLQYATSLNNVPLHAGPNGRAAESQEMLRRAVDQSNGGPNKMPLLAEISASSSSCASNGDMLTMRPAGVSTLPPPPPPAHPRPV